MGAFRVFLRLGEALQGEDSDSVDSGKGGGGREG